MGTKKVTRNELTPEQIAYLDAMDKANKTGRSVEDEGKTREIAEGVSHEIPKPSARIVTRGKTQGYEIFVPVSNNPGFLQENRHKNENRFLCMINESEQDVGDEHGDVYTVSCSIFRREKTVTGKKAVERFRSTGFSV